MVYYLNIMVNSWQPFTVEEFLTYALCSYVDIWSVVVISQEYVIVRKRELKLLNRKDGNEGFWITAFGVNDEGIVKMTII